MAIGPIKIGTSWSDVYTAPAPDTLHINRDGGGNVIMTWSNPLFSLYSAANVVGPYLPVSGAVSGYSTAATGTTFYRLAY